MRLVQYRDGQGRRGVAAVGDRQEAVRLREVETVYELALEAIESGRPLAELVLELASIDRVDLDAAEAERRLLPPIDHPVPTRCWVTSSGLTHASAAAAARQLRGGDERGQSESSKLLAWGEEGGKPAAGVAGTQPEWCFRGNGASLLGAAQPLPLPDFAEDGGEEAELVACYVISEDGIPCRVGWALGNEFSDHGMERRNALYLAHAKLRASAVGPELLVGALPADVRGAVRVHRGGEVIWERQLATGEANMIHSFANLEHHHFKYPMFRRPGDVHLHFFGASVASCQDGLVAAPGDVFEIDVPLFGRPLRNPVEAVRWPAPAVRPL
jgi:hypothetical protein